MQAHLGWAVCEPLRPHACAHGSVCVVVSAPVRGGHVSHETLMLVWSRSDSPTAARSATSR